MENYEAEAKTISSLIDTLKKKLGDEPLELGEKGRERRRLSATIIYLKSALEQLISLK